MKGRAEGRLFLADLFDNPSDPFILDDPWLDVEADPPEFWYMRVLTPEESAGLTWR